MSLPVHSIQFRDSEAPQFALTSIGTYQVPLAERIRDAIARATENGRSLDKDEIRAIHNESTLIPLSESQEWIREA